MMFSRDNNTFLLRKKFVAILLIFSAIFNFTLADTQTSGTGAVARFFEYPLGDDTSFTKLPFLLRDFRTNKYLGEVTGIKNISWDSGWPAVVPPFGFEGAPITNFLVSITGYYCSPQGGTFNMTLKADGFAAVFWGINAAPMHFYNFTVGEFLFSTNGSAASGLKTATKRKYLEYGWCYPIEIIYVNYRERGVLNFEITLPDGTVDTQFGERLYTMPYRDIHFFSSEVSFNSIYETFTRSIVADLTTPTTVSTSIYTDWIEYYSADVYVFNYVDVPVSTTAPTTTTTADVSVPITSTYTTVISGNFGSSAPEVFFNFDLEVEVKY